MKDKVLFIDSTFTKQLPSGGEPSDSVYIEGYASTNEVDRANDVVPTSVWEKGIQNYLKNPIILAQHDYDDPIGRMVEYKIDSKGLWIKARISAAAEIFNLVKDEVVTAFSVGFRINDAEYNAATELFVVKDLELIEISVVSIPCNQNTLFSLSKAFSDADEYNNFKSQFAPKSESAKGLESSTDADSISQKEVEMTQDEIKQMVAEATAKALAEQATAKALADAQEADVQARIKAAVAAVTPTETGAEKLLAEVEKRFAEQAESTKSVLSGLEAALADKAKEIEAIQKSKMTFADNKQDQGPTYEEKEKAYILSNIMRKSIGDTKFGKQLVEKYGQHLPSATWELEVSLNMEQEIRRKLIVAPLFRTIAMQTNVMKIPLNPEAGLATWAAQDGSDFGGSGSAGSTTSTSGATPGSGSPHALKEITLSSYKVATKEYMNYEEEEDSLVVLLPIIRDAMVRRIARALDRAYLLGQNSSSDPIKGLAAYSTSSTAPLVGAVATAVTVAKLRGLRANLGSLGLDPADVTYVVNSDVYYNLLDDSTFQTMNQVGPQATLLTGQIGQIGNSPVLVSGELPASTTNAGTSSIANIGAMAIYTGNFVVGNQRGLRMDTQELVETQRRVMVASLRTGFAQLSTNLGSGVACLRFTT